MVSLLRQIVAGPRARHHEAGLDLCYVTDFLIATSGPSQTYPELAYRNPLDQLVAFLDAKHGRDWAVWEFRAEGTGYPDDAVYGRIWHYPWPDHHPPPFRLVPMMMASMRNWLHGGGGDDTTKAQSTTGTITAGSSTTETDTAADSTTEATDTGQGLTTTETANAPKTTRNKKRVVVVHCKAGKGRSGTASCSYLIAEEGWAAADALRRFTERRMRPQFGLGVSIPSQLRWVGYVDRWTRGGKRYTDRRIEVRWIRAYGLRGGVRIEVEGFADEGKTIERVGAFGREERVVEEPGAPEGGSSLADIVWDLAGYPVANDGGGGGGAPPRDATAKSGEKDGQKKEDAVQDGTEESVGMMLWRKGLGLMDKVAPQGEHAKIDRLRARMQPDAPPPPEKDQDKDRDRDGTAPPRASESAEDPEPGGKTVVFRPARPIVLRNSDINISVERRTRSSRSMGLTVTTAVAHVWFNAFFEGNGPERGGRPDREGVFAIDWEGMDGIKGSSRKGARALDRLAVAWRAVDVPEEEEEEEEEIREPAEGEFVPQAEPADWHLDGRGVPEEQELGEDDMEGVKTSGPSGGLL